MPSCSRAVEHLHRERLVQFPQADVVDLEVEALEQLVDRVDRADAHLVGLGAGDRHADVAAHRRDAAAFGLLGFHQDRCRAAVGKLAGIAGRDRRVGSEHRVEAGQAFQRRVGAVSFVLGDRHFLLRDLARLLVLDRHRGGDGNDLLVEPAGGLRRGGALLALQRIFVLPLAADAVAPATVSAVWSIGM